MAEISMTLASDLRLGLAQLQLDLPEAVCERLLAYLRLIAKWNRSYNLTAVRDETRMLTHHLLDSLAVLPHVRGPSVLDVGSGPGLPGIPLAIACPHWRLTLLDANHKKTTFLRQAIIELQLSNVDVVCERVEHWQAPARFDTVISRAFADLSEFLRLAGRHCAPDGQMVAMKGVYPHEEVARLPADFSLRDVIALQVPGLAAERHAALLQPA